MTEERKTDSPFGLRTALDGKTRLESQARVGKWRDGVAMLSHHITAQMEQCKELRNHVTLKQIASEDPDQRDRKRLGKFVDSVKADIRTLHNEVCERMLGKPIKGQLRPAVPVPAGGVTWQMRTTALEKQLEGFSIDPARMGRLGAQNLVDLLDLRAGLLVELAEYMANKKNALDSSLGITVDIARTIDDDNPIMKSSRDVRAFLRVIESFVDMESLIKQANMSSDTVRHSKTVAKLQSQQANLRTRLAESQKRVEELEARVKILRAGEDGRAPGMQTLQLDEAVTRMRMLEKRDQRLRDQNATIMTRNGELEDMAVRLRTSLNEVTAKHKSDTEWYQPRIRALETSIKQATTTIQTVQMDVELLASMYKSGVDELEAMQRKVDAAHKERAEFAAKLHKQIRTVVALRNEVRRKENISIQLNAARLATLDSYKDVKDVIANAREEQNSAKQRILKLNQDVISRDARIAALEEQLASAVAAKEEAEARKVKAEEVARRRTEQKAAVDAELHAMTQKVVEAGLDEAGLSRYAKLQKKHGETLRRQAALEKQIEDQEQLAGLLRKKVAKLTTQLEAEGVVVDATK